MNKDIKLIYNYALKKMKFIQCGNIILKSHGMLWWRIENNNIILKSDPPNCELLNKLRTDSSLTFTNLP